MAIAFLRYGALLLLTLTLLVQGVFTPTSAAEYLIDTWRFDDDLPRDGIHSMAQGADGYLWVSSHYGLARFDGTRFLNVSTGAQFLGHHYAELSADSSGAVWIATPGSGLLRWRNGRLQTHVRSGDPRFGPLLAGLTNAAGQDLALSPDGRILAWSNGVQKVLLDVSRWGGPVRASVTQDRQGNMWFTTYQRKLVRVSGTNAAEFTYGEGEARRAWVTLETDASGELWAGTQQDLGLLRDGRFEPFTRPTGGGLFPVEDLIAVPRTAREISSPVQGGSVPDSNRMWVIALGRAWLLEGRQWVTNVSFETNNGLYVTSPRLADQQGNLWFTATRARLLRASPNGTLLRIEGEDGLPAGRVVSLYEDREKSVWVGLEHAGLARLRTRYVQPVGTRAGIKAPLAWTVLQDRSGAIWMGTENNGLERWQNGELTAFSVSKSEGAGPGSVYSLCLDRTGKLWAGTGDHRVLQYENGSFVQVWEHSSPAWNNRVYAIYEDRAGRMWFGTGMGLFVFEDGKVRACEFRSGGDMAVVRTITEDMEGRLWVGFSGGNGPKLAFVDRGFLEVEAMPKKLSHADVFGLHTGSDGSLWIGTSSDGLWRRLGGVYQHFTQAEGLPDDRIYSVAEDKAGNLWLGSPAGIIRLSRASIGPSANGMPEPLDCLTFDRSDGLPTRECSGGTQPAIWQTEDGGLLFAMKEAAASVRPDSIRINEVPPPVLIEQVLVDGTSLEGDPAKAQPAHEPGPGRQVRRLVLAPGKHVVEFQYTAPSLVVPSKIRFKRRLEGVDKDWRGADASRSAMYSLTAPGKYRFHVIACNNDGVWNESGAEVALVVQPHMWQTWWFRAGAFVFLLGGVGGSIRFVERRKLERKLEQLEMQQMVEKERARIARDIHDELGSSLTEIGLLSEFAQRETTLPEQVRTDVRRIAEKTMSSTRALDEIVWAVNPRHDTLESFVSYACAYAEEQLGLAGVRCRLSVPSPIAPRPLRADLRHHLFLAYKEALNNVLKHAKASVVEISIQISTDMLDLSITDDGRGFKTESMPLEGEGLRGIAERMKHLGGTFECHSAPGKGTRLTLSLKL